jgi:hypothetical protein
MPNRIREGDTVLVPELVDRGNVNRSRLTFPHVCEGQAKANRTRSMSRGLRGRPVSSVRVPQFGKIRNFWISASSTVSYQRVNDERDHIEKFLPFEHLEKYMNLSFVRTQSL